MEELFLDSAPIKEKEREPETLRMERIALSSMNILSYFEKVSQGEWIFGSWFYSELKRFLEYFITEGNWIFSCFIFEFSLIWQIIVTSSW